MDPSRQLPHIPMTRAEVKEAFGPIAAKLTEQGVWPDPDALAIRLANVRKEGRVKANAGDRYRAKDKSESIKEGT